MWSNGAIGHLWWPSGGGRGPGGVIHGATDTGFTHRSHVSIGHPSTCPDSEGIISISRGGVTVVGSLTLLSLRDFTANDGPLRWKGCSPLVVARSAARAPAFRMPSETDPRGCSNSLKPCASGSAKKRCSAAGASDEPTGVSQLVRIGMPPRFLVVSSRITTFEEALCRDGRRRQGRRSRLARYVRNSRGGHRGAQADEYEYEMHHRAARSGHFSLSLPIASPPLVCDPLKIHCQIRHFQLLLKVWK